MELTPGNYNVSVEFMEGQTLVYSFSGSLEIIKGSITKTYDITLTKHSATVSGYTTFGGTNIVNVTNIIFEPDLSIINNTALFGNAVKSDETGYYSLELSPGSYIVNVNYSTSENDQNYTYTFNGILKVEASHIDTGVTYNIAMSRRERE